MRFPIAARPATWLLGLASTLALVACDGAPGTLSQAPPGSSQPAAESPVTTSTCPATAQIAEPDRLPVRQGAGDGATLWALFFPTEPELTAGKEIKVAWRMTGSGSLSISATGPDGTVINPVWGPEPHSSSTWNAPGEEWGTGWVFPAAGCWTINAKRTNGSGYLVLRVADQAG